MCVGCRSTDSWSALLRVVALAGEDGGNVSLTPDPSHRMSGRGAWLHPTSDCFEQAVRRKAFVRALRLAHGPDVAPVLAHLDSALTMMCHRPVHLRSSQPTESGSSADEHPMSTQR